MSKSGLFIVVRNQPCVWKMVGLIGLEPMTPALSRRCSNQLSYRPGGKFAVRSDRGLSERLEWWRLTDSNR